jgi:hypothetical protein
LHGGNGRFLFATESCTSHNTLLRTAGDDTIFSRREVPITASRANKTYTSFH